MVTYHIKETAVLTQFLLLYGPSPENFTSNNTVVHKQKLTFILLKKNKQTNKIKLANCRTIMTTK